MLGDGLGVSSATAAAPRTPALIDQLYPEVATVILFVVAVLCMVALLYISLNWE